MTPRPDAAYKLTRRRGERGTVTRVTSSKPDPLSGQKTQTKIDTVLRWIVKMPVEYKRVFSANAAQTRIGTTQFIIWTKDADFVKLSQDDFITFPDLSRYEIVTSKIEDTAFVITANEVENWPLYVPKFASNELGLVQTLTFVVT